MPKFKALDAAVDVAPDTRSMATSKGTGSVCYNVQAAVDAQHRLIVAHEVTNVGFPWALRPYSRRA